MHACRLEAGQLTGLRQDTNWLEVGGAVLNPVLWQRGWPAEASGAAAHLMWLPTGVGMPSSGPWVPRSRLSPPSSSASSSPPAWQEQQEWSDGYGVEASDR